ncbi:MAG: histidine--tRNA ligase [Candidatus Acidiferrales bacterium]
MSEQPKFRAIKGTRDILPPETALWNRVEQTAREVFGTYGYGEIRLPIFEQTELFARSIGVDTDVVSKEMYTWEDHEHSDLVLLRSTILHREPDFNQPKAVDLFLRQVDDFVLGARGGIDHRTIPGTALNLRILGDAGAHISHVRGAMAGPRWSQSFLSGLVATLKDMLQKFEIGPQLCLRPEATASVCRAYIEHGMQTLPGNVKLYYMGPMFRRERPQKGRYRQFYQIGAEVLGQSDAPAIDAELIEMLLVFFERTGLNGATLSVNSIGDKNCRPQYVDLLRAELSRVKDKLGADSQRRIETNPLRVLDSKLPEEQAIIEKLPRIADHLCDDCRAHFAELQAELKLRGIAYEINWRLVRGLDYYTRTTFEIVAPGLGSQNAVCGGGRYDGLVELLGGPPTKGIGFAIGLDRLILSLQEAAQTPATNSLDVYIAWMGEKSYALSVRLARKLRDAGVSVELPPEEMKFKKSLGLADKLSARFALIIGEDEVASGQFTLKRLADGEQRKLPEAELLAELKNDSIGRRD